MEAKHYIDAQTRLPVGEVHVWRADLDAAGAQIARLLDEHERERAARIVREPARRRWIAARGVLRVLLGAYTNRRPETLRFAEESRGKPILDLPGAGRLRFNLSHSGGLAIYALTEMCSVGVDVELVVRHPRERPRREDFLREWVRGEAQGKLLGVGATNPKQASATAKAWTWMVDLELGSNAIATLALEQKPLEFQVYEIDFRAGGSMLPATSQPS